PSPYLYYFNFGDEAIIGSSPEMLVKTEGKTVTTVPIAGTRPRGKTDAEDELLARELLADPKERAEHLMLVDLARNDIGRVSEFGTVQVSDFMSIDKFSHVQHITSVVTGELQEEMGPVDALEACFPAGTVSGAPKIRAMQIIEDLEPIPRGIYSGAVGYIGFDGLMEFAIAIRTVIVKNNFATCQAGAGIVADSVPSKEFDETQAKAGAIAQAVLSAGGFP
ncbi:MAG TPA: anthranilate synthase component I family protein, partial [Methanospirillum sp.]|uniref:anthranilate synthase component I family protein n=1 Tax=Methanospirillum sp. TaxID=45200 RepID=UPI002C0FB807